MRKVADRVREIMGKPPGKRDWEVSAIDGSGHIGEPTGHWSSISTSIVRTWSGAELYRPYSRAQYHLRVSEIDPKVQQQIIIWMAGEHVVNGPKIVDSSGFSIASSSSGNTPSTASSACTTLPRCISYTRLRERYAPPW